jgi:hypothetical protein
MPEEPVKADAVITLDALLKLGVDVERHLRVGVADLAHYPLDANAWEVHSSCAGPGAFAAPPGRSTFCAATVARLRASIPAPRAVKSGPKAAGLGPEKDLVRARGA